MLKMIKFEDFHKLEIRIGEVLVAEKAENMVAIQLYLVF